MHAQGQVRAMDGLHWLKTIPLSSSLNVSPSLK
jgi:hypothetical protein